MPPCPSVMAVAMGGGDGLWQEGHCQRPVQAEEPAQRPYAPHGGRGAGGAARQDGQEVLFQQIDLGVDGHRQTDGGRPQKEIDETAAGVIGVIGDVKDHQHGDDHTHRQHQAVADDEPGLFLDPAPQPVGQGRQRHPEEGGLPQLRHDRFPLSSRRQVRRTAPAAAAKVTAVDTVQITKRASRCSRTMSA